MGLSIKYGEDWKGFLEDFIPYLEKTPEDSWCIDVVRNEKGNCLFGHLSNFCGHKDNDRVDLDFEWFEYFIASTYMVYPVNDGKDERYAQSSIKERCVSYMEDILSGRELSSLAWLKIDEEASLRNIIPYTSK